MRNRSTGSWALLPEGYDGQFFLETRLLVRIAGARQAVSQFDEAIPFLLPASIPGSMSSTMMWLALMLLVFASDFIRRATRAGNVTL